MKKLLPLAALTALVWAFLAYSSPGEYSREEIEAISEHTTVLEATHCGRFYEEPVRVAGDIRHGFGLRFAGFCTIEQEGYYAACLMRGFPPQNHATMDCVIIPRRVITIGGRCFFLCAIVAYRPGQAVSLD